MAILTWIGGAIGVLTIFILSTVFKIPLERTTIPIYALSPLIAGIIAGFGAKRNSGRSGMKAGVLVILLPVIFSLLLIISAAPNTDFNALEPITIRGIGPIGAVMGGLATGIARGYQGIAMGLGAMLSALARILFFVILIVVFVTAIVGFLVFAIIGGIGGKIGGKLRFRRK